MARKLATRLPKAAPSKAAPAKAPPAVAVAAAVLCAVLLAACSPASGRHLQPTLPGGLEPAPVTASQIARILSATMSSNNKANATLDSGLLQSYESGSALAIDRAGYEENANVTTNDCTYAPFGVHVLQAVADGGDSYPQRFLVVGQTEPAKASGNCAAGQCPTADTLLAFERTAPGKPWKIVLEPAADSGKFVSLATDDGDTAARMSQTSLKDAADIGSRLAADLDNYGRTGQRGGLEPAYFTGDCWSLPDVHS
ncbi:MAG TPA: hypothetical protein VGP46_04755, partial [Acidimicrobiales bacterium]|nr:hypothetical protein [Acidimicrobiales bacterium]